MLHLDKQKKQEESKKKFPRYIVLNVDGSLNQEMPPNKIIVLYLSFVLACDCVVVDRVDKNSVQDHLPNRHAALL